MFPFDIEDWGEWEYIIKRNICNVKKPAIRGGSKTVIKSKTELFVTVG